MGRLGFIFTARVLHRRPLSDVAKGGYDVDRGQASQRWYSWTLSKWLHMKVFECQFFLACRGWNIFIRGQRSHLDHPRWCAKDIFEILSWRQRRLKTKMWKTKWAVRLSDQGYYLRTQVDGSDVTSHRVVHSKSQRATSCLSQCYTH